MGWRTNHRPSWTQLCQKERKWAEVSGGHRAAVHGVDGARGVVEDHPGQCPPGLAPDLVLGHTASPGTQVNIVPRNSEGGARGPRLEQRVKDNLVCTVYILQPH